MRSQSDLIAGAAAAASFIAMWGLLGTPFLWVSAILGIAVYTGIRLAFGAQKQQQEEPQVVDPSDWVIKIRGLEVQFIDPDIRKRIDALCKEAETLIADLKARPDPSVEGTFLVGQYLEQAYNGLSLFLSRTRGGAEWTEKATEMLGSLLDTILDRFAKLHERVNAQDDAALASEIKVLTDTLNEVDNVTLNLKSGTQ